MKNLEISAKPLISDGHIYSMSSFKPLSTKDNARESKHVTEATDRSLEWIKIMNSLKIPAFNHY